MDASNKLQKVEKWLHVLLLALLYLFLYLTYPETFVEDTPVRLYWTIFFDFIVFAGCTYFAAYVLLPRFFILGKYGLFFVNYVGTMLIGATLILVNDLILMSMYPIPEEIDVSSTALLFLVSTLGMMFMISSVGIGIRALLYWLRSAQQLNALKQEKLQTELAFLRSQLNPHFLFNMINLIFGHIDKTNKTARDLTVQFSELLRYQLYECDVAFIAIEKEISYLHTYIGLQKQRKSGNLDCTVTTSGDLTGFQITPMLMIPFVENAFKFVSYDDHQENILRVEIARTGNEFRFRCVNTKARMIAEEVIKSGGLGLQNVRRRLQLIYPEKHTLFIRDLDDTFEVELTLELA